MVEPILQVALDIINLHRALQIAKEAVEGGADWIEVGTPLIKSEGMNAIREIKKTFPNYTIVADMKTMDVGGFETEIASKSGANVVCVMGISSNSTIKEAIRVGKKYGTKIMADLMEIEDKIKRARELEEMGVDFICMHVSIDEQMFGKKVKDLKDVAKKVKIPIAVAGGLNSETVSEVVKAGASIIIVGGAIVKAEKVAEATSIIKKAILDKKAIKSELFKKYSKNELYEAFMKVSTPNIADAMHKKGVMRGIRPLKKGYKMVGQAITVRTADGDFAKPVEAVDRAKKGDVIVIDAGGGHIAIWGELASWSCIMKGISGVVIDGAIRDVDDIIEMDFPAFTKHIAPNAGEPKGFGEIGVEITCGGICIQNGDWIIGDDSGVVVVPQRRAQEIANRALDVLERENRLREEIKRGSTLSKVLKLEKWEKVG